MNHCGFLQNDCILSLLSLSLLTPESMVQKCLMVPHLFHCRPNTENLDDKTKLTNINNRECYPLGKLLQEIHQKKTLLKNQKWITNYFASFLLIHCFKHPFHSRDTVAYFWNCFYIPDFSLPYFSVKVLHFLAKEQKTMSNLKIANCKKTIPRTTLHSEKWQENTKICFFI